MLLGSIATSMLCLATVSGPNAGLAAHGSYPKTVQVRRIGEVCTLYSHCTGCFHINPALLLNQTASSAGHSSPHLQAHVLYFVTCIAHLEVSKLYLRVMHKA